MSAALLVVSVAAVSAAVAFNRPNRYAKRIQKSPAFRLGFFVPIDWSSGRELFSRRKIQHRKRHSPREQAPDPFAFHASVVR